MNNQAPELSPETRRLIQAARGADDPTAEDHARVKARWLASVAALAGVSSLTEAARAAGGIGWGFKAAGAALVVAAGAIGLNFALDSGSPEPRALPGVDGSAHERFQKTPRPRDESSEAPAAPPPAAPAVVPSPAPVPAAPVEPAQPSGAELAAPAEPLAAAPVVAIPVVEARGRASAVTKPRDAARPRSRTAPARPSGAKADEREQVAAGPSAEAASPSQSGQLGEELALLSEVRSSIQSGAGARALELLSQYRGRFGQPILGMEADALRVDALCKSGQREAARESARAFQNEWPGSPLEQRVSAACP